jgi:mRNA-degrading endonuclease YafQ of YafQ-DinJ toxin-antitoxin module
MKIIYHKRFEKQFRKLTPKFKNKVIEVIGIFINDPLNKRLLSHNLKGNLLGKKAISINSDLRIFLRNLMTILWLYFLIWVLIIVCTVNSFNFNYNF